MRYFLHKLQFKRFSTTQKIISLCLLLAICFILPIHYDTTQQNADSILTYFDTKTLEYYNDTLKQVSIVWASVKFASKFVALLQRAEISLQPFGFGITFAPGELLAVVGDNLEKISSILFILMTLLFVQKLSIGFLSFVLVKCILPIGLFSLILFVLTKKLIIFKNFAFFLFKFSLLIWCAFHLSAFLSHLVSSHFLQKEFDSNMQSIASQTQNLEKIQSDFQLTQTTEPLTQNLQSTNNWFELKWQEMQGFFGKIKNTLPKDFASLQESFAQQLSACVSYLDNMIDTMIHIIAIFLITCVAIPILVFVLLFYSAKIIH